MKRLVWPLALLMTAGLAQAAMELVPYRIDETRSAALVPDKIGRMPDSLKLTFSLKGAEVESAVKYGDLKIDEAVDDKGTSLIPAKDVINEASKFKEFSNSFWRKNDLEAKRPAAAPQIEMTLGLPKRAATKVARLRGSISVTSQGTIKSVELAAMKTGDKKKLDIPANAGITIAVNIKPGKDVSEIGIEITGDENAMESIEVVDAAGKKVSNGMSSWSMAGGPVQKSLGLDKPLDNTMKLVAKIALDRKVTKIPFDLKDIALP